MLIFFRGEIMKILVIGNGFDLDHGLETGYKNFLTFCDIIMQFHNTKETEDLAISDNHKNYLSILKDNQKLLDKFVDLLKKNKLFDYLSNKNKSNNWIDLEAELQDILIDIDFIEQKLIDANATETQLPANNKSYRNISKIFGNEFAVSSIAPAACRISIETWLNQLSMALELYIAHFINLTEIEYYSPDIVNFDADRVISFNYSNTYERIYSLARANSYCNYIHGKATTDGKNNIVLGITDSSEEHDKRTTNCKFEKYFQRISKNTSNIYKDWLDSEERKELMFFGHSLFSSDGDIIKELITECDEITVCYYNDEMYQNIIQHLVEILGKNKLLDYTYGYNAKIHFVQQRKRSNVIFGGLEISRDIQKIKRLYAEPEKSVRNFIERINDKIQTKDLNYFHSQSKIIELAKEIFMYRIPIKGIAQLKDIAFDLEYHHLSKGPIEFHFDISSIPSHRNSAEYSQLVTLITGINNDNNKRFNKDKNNNWKTYYENNPDASVTKVILRGLSYIKSDDGWNNIVNFLLDLNEDDVKQSLNDLAQQNLAPVKRIRLSHLTDIFYEKAKIYHVNEDDDDLPF